MGTKVGRPGSASNPSAGVEGAVAGEQRLGRPLRGGLGEADGTAHTWLLAPPGLAGDACVAAGAALRADRTLRPGATLRTGGARGTGGAAGPAGPCGPAGASLPVPLRVTSCGEPGASLINRSDAFRAPVALGAKRTPTLQVPLRGNVSPLQESKDTRKSSGLAPTARAELTLSADRRCW